MVWLVTGKWFHTRRIRKIYQKRATTRIQKNGVNRILCNF